MLILTVIQGPGKGRRFELPDDEPQQIGRSSESLQLGDQTISRRHAELTPDDGHWYVQDLHSSNGTYVNARRISERTLLEPGDQIRAGRTLILFGKEAPPPRRHGVKIARRDEMDAHVESIALSNDDSMIMAVPEPTGAAVEQLKVVYELTQLIGSTVDRQTLLEKIMGLIFEQMQAERGFILLQNSPAERPDPVVVRIRHMEEGVKPPKIVVSRTVVQHVLSRGEGVLSSNAMNDSRFSAGESVQQYGLRSALCVPIKYKDRIYGVINLDSRVANYTFTEDQLKLLTAIGVYTGLALANIELYAEHIQQERLAAIGQTVAALSHSIKNILQGLRGGADVLDLGLRKKNLGVVSSGWEIVVRNLDRIIDLTMNMLAYSKQRKPELEMASLPKLLDEIVELVQKQFDRRKVALLTDYDSDMPPVPFDVSGIHQAVLNLLNNALDAVESETGSVTLACEYNDERHEVSLRASDNGMGIPKSMMDDLYKPFRSTKGLKGTGLGLAVTKKIVEEHGGRITIATDEGKGTTFNVILPTVVDEVSSADTVDPGMEDSRG